MDEEAAQRRRNASVFASVGLIGAWWSMLMVLLMFGFVYGLGLEATLTAVIAVELLFIACILYAIYLSLVGQHAEKK